MFRTYYLKYSIIHNYSIMLHLHNDIDNEGLFYHVDDYTITTIE